MTSVTPNAGAVPSYGNGPGGHPSAPPSSSSREPPRAVSRLVGGVAGSRGAGVALSRIPHTDLFAVTVLDGSGAKLLPLGPFSEEEVVALWRGIGASSGLPLVIERADGSLEHAVAQIGRVQLGAVRIRRRHGLLNGRRPRFLVRRKTGRCSVRPQVFREREMFAGR